MVQVSGGQLITSTGQHIMVQAVPGGQGQTIMQVPVSGSQGLQQVSGIEKCLGSISEVFKRIVIISCLIIDIVALNCFLPSLCI